MARVAYLDGLRDDVRAERHLDAAGLGAANFPTMHEYTRFGESPTPGRARARAGGPSDGSGGPRGGLGRALAAHMSKNTTGLAIFARGWWCV